MIELGIRVKDMITGKTGVAVARTEWLYGCSRIGIESEKLDDGKPREIDWFDEQRVEEVKGKVKVPVTPSRDRPEITLGSEVKDELTGFTGIAVARTIWLGGNVNIGIEPTKLHDGKPIDAHNFDIERVKLIKAKAPPMSKSANKNAPGGPQRDPKPRSLKFRH